MSFLDIFKSIILSSANNQSDNCNDDYRYSLFSHKRPSKQDKYVKVKSKGAEKQYRINKYGEVFEE